MSKRTVKDLLLDAVRFEEVYYAHEIYIAVQKGLIKLTDDEKAYSSVEVSKEEVEAAAKENRLGIAKTYLYAVPLTSRAEFAFYLARDKESAERLHLVKFKESAAKVMDVTNRMFVAISYPGDPLRKAKTFFEIKEQLTTFPCLVCVMDAAQKSNKKGL